MERRRTLDTDPTTAEEEVDAVELEGGARRARKPYQRPNVVKRRSLSQATLIGSGGTAGTLSAGG